MVSIRIVSVDYYMCYPQCDLDIVYSEFRGTEVRQVPVIQVFGSTQIGKKTCLNVHGVFPYIYIPYDGIEAAGSLSYKIATELDKTINISLGQASSNTSHVHNVILVSGTPMYGYYEKQHQFFKIYFYNPAIIKKACSLLENGAVLGKSFQPHESHINYIQQFMIDYNLHGMSFINVSQVKHRLNPNYPEQEKNISIDKILPNHLQRRSVCELEMDCFATDIINIEDVLSGNLGVNPGIAALWDDERQRRRDKQEDSQVSFCLTQEREFTDEPIASNELLARRLNQKLSIELSEENTSSLELNNSVYPAETPEDSDYLITSATNLTAANSSMFEQTIVSDSQPTIELSQTDKNLLEILKELKEKAHVEDDSVLSQQNSQSKVEDSPSEEEDEVELSLPLDKIVQVPEDVWNDSFWDENCEVPQLDGIHDTKSVNEFIYEILESTDGTSEEVDSVSTIPQKQLSNVLRNANEVFIDNKSGSLSSEKRLNPGLNTLITTEPKSYIPETARIKILSDLCVKTDCDVKLTWELECNKLSLKIEKNDYVSPSGEFENLSFADNEMINYTLENEFDQLNINEIILNDVNMGNLTPTNSTSMDATDVLSPRTPHAHTNQCSCHQSPNNSASRLFTEDSLNLFNDRLYENDLQSSGDKENTSANTLISNYRENDINAAKRNLHLVLTNNGKTKPDLDDNKSVLKYNLRSFKNTPKDKKCKWCLDACTHDDLIHAENNIDKIKEPIINEKPLNNYTKVKKKPYFTLNSLLKSQRKTKFTNNEENTLNERILVQLPLSKIIKKRSRSKILSKNIDETIKTDNKIIQLKSNAQQNPVRKRGKPKRILETASTSSDETNHINQFELTPNTSNILQKDGRNNNKIIPLESNVSAIPVRKRERPKQAIKTGSTSSDKTDYINETIKFTSIECTTESTSIISKLQKNEKNNNEIIPLKSNISPISVRKLRRLRKAIETGSTSSDETDHNKYNVQIIKFTSNKVEYTSESTLSTGNTTADEELTSESESNLTSIISVKKLNKIKLNWNLDGPNDTPSSDSEHSQKSGIFDEKKVASTSSVRTRSSLQKVALVKSPVSDLSKTFNKKKEKYVPGDNHKISSRLLRNRKSSINKEFTQKVDLIPKDECNINLSELDATTNHVKSDLIVKKEQNSNETSKSYSMRNLRKRKCEIKANNNLIEKPFDVLVNETNQSNGFLINSTEIAYNTLIKNEIVTLIESSVEIDDLKLIDTDMNIEYTFDISAPKTVKRKLRSSNNLEKSSETERISIKNEATELPTSNSNDFNSDEPLNSNKLVLRHKSKNSNNKREMRNLNKKNRLSLSLKHSREKQKVEKKSNDTIIKIEVKEESDTIKEMKEEYYTIKKMKEESDTIKEMKEESNEVQSNLLKSAKIQDLRIVLEPLSPETLAKFSNKTMNKLKNTSNTENQRITRNSFKLASNSLDSLTVNEKKIELTTPQKLKNVKSNSATELVCHETKSKKLEFQQIKMEQSCENNSSKSEKKLAARHSLRLVKNQDKLKIEEHTSSGSCEEVLEPKLEKLNTSPKRSKNKISPKKYSPLNVTKSPRKSTTPQKSANNAEIELFKKRLRNFDANLSIEQDHLSKKLKTNEMVGDSSRGIGELQDYPIIQNENSIETIAEIKNEKTAENKNETIGGNKSNTVITKNESMNISRNISIKNCENEYNENSSKNARLNITTKRTPNSIKINLFNTNSNGKCQDENNENHNEWKQKEEKFLNEIESICKNNTKLYNNAVTENERELCENINQKYANNQNYNENLLKSPIISPGRNHIIPESIIIDSDLSETFPEKNFKSLDNPRSSRKLLKISPENLISYQNQKKSEKKQCQTFPEKLSQNFSEKDCEISVRSVKEDFDSTDIQYQNSPEKNDQRSKRNQYKTTSEKLERSISGHSSAEKICQPSPPEYFYHTRSKSYETSPKHEKLFLHSPVAGTPKKSIITSADYLDYSPFASPEKGTVYLPFMFNSHETLSQQYENQIENEKYHTKTKNLTIAEQYDLERDFAPLPGTSKDNDEFIEFTKNKSIYARATQLNLSQDSLTLSDSPKMLMPDLHPPSSDKIKNTLLDYDIPEVRLKTPFYSNPADVTHKMDVGNNLLRIPSNTFAELNEFKGSLGYEGIEIWRRNKFKKLYPNAEVPNTNLYASLSGHSKVIVQPSKMPPKKNETTDWIKIKQMKKIEIKKPDKIRIVIPSSPGEDNDESFSLSPDLISATPSQESKKYTSHSSPCLRSKRNPRRGTLQRKALFASRKSSQSFQDQINLKDIQRDNRNCNNSCQITGVSLNNTHGFKLSYENLQNAKAVCDNEHLTILVIELHIRTRGELNPDPQYDGIRAIFYSITNDVPSEHPLPKQETGIIAVNSLPVSPTKQISDPILNGLGLDCVINYVDSELNLIDELIKLIRKWDPDIFTGFEIEMLSWGYLVERCYILSINLPVQISRTNPDVLYKKKNENFEPNKDELKLTGRIVLDAWRLFRHEIALTSYTFENLMYHILHRRVPHHSYKNLSFWWDHRSNHYRKITADYYITRIEGILKLMEQLDLIGRTCELARLFGIQFYEVLSRGSQFRVESMMLRLAKPLNFIPVSPSVQQRAKMRAPEWIPLIFEPESRYYADPIIVLDFQSLYPSIIIAYNYCFSTCIGRVDNLGTNQPFEFGATQLKIPRSTLQKLKDHLTFSPCGVGFVTSNIRKGILPRMLQEILETRLMVKASMKRNKDNKVLQRVLHSRQLGLKLIANVTYGYTAANFSGRMPCSEVGDSVVSKGRETLERAIKLIEQNKRWKAKIVYGDTDSIFVQVPGRSRASAFKIGEEIADAVTKTNPAPIKLKLEKVYHPCILQTKKRYVGYMYESAEQTEPKYNAKGIETVRRDGCPAVAKMLEKSLRILFETCDVSLVKRYVCHQFEKLLSRRASVQDLIFAREYRGAGGYRPGACVPALELAKKWTSIDKRKEPRRGERVPYIVVHGPPGVPLIRLVRCPRDLLNQQISYHPNAVYYITKVIIPPLNRCFTLIGADINTWYNEMPRKQHQIIPTDIHLEKSKKSTISQYFATMNCVICNTQTNDEGLCETCFNQPQSTIVALYEKIGKWERSLSEINQICQSCCSRTDNTECTSLDCPVLYRLNQTKKDVKQVPFLRNLIFKF